MINQCCECRRIQQDDRRVAPDAFFPAGERVSHGYCSTCAEKTIHDAASYRFKIDRNSTTASDWSGRRTWGEGD